MNKWTYQQVWEREYTLSKYVVTVTPKEGWWDFYTRDLMGEYWEHQQTYKCYGIRDAKLKIKKHRQGEL